MEVLTTSSILISVFVVLLTWAVNWVWIRPKKLERILKKQGILGSSYKFLVGNLNELKSMRSHALETPINGFSHDYLPRVEAFRYHLMTKFGRRYVLWAGPRPIIHISEPELIREALNKMHDFQKPKFNPISDKLLPGVVSYEGDKWSKHRKIINPAFHLDKLKLMLPAFHKSCIEMIDKWEKMVGETGYNEIDVWPYLTTLTSDVISRAAFGSSYQEGQRLFELLKDQIRLTLSIAYTVYVPGMRYIPTSSNRKFKKIEDDIHTLLKRIINKRKDAIESGEEAKDDLLGILLDSNLKEMQQGTFDNTSKQLGMNLKEVIDECKLFYLAGQETTSVLLVWTLILLGKNQDWQRRAREEVMQVFGENIPDFEGLNHLKIVTMILYEVLRLYPPVTHFSRKINHNIQLGDLSLPGGTLVNFQIAFVHRDKDIWGEAAQEFEPERFSEGIYKATEGNVAFFPFGWGPRKCLGDKFAMTEAKMALSMILQRLSFELSPSYSHAPMSVLFLQPQYGAQIIFHNL